MNTHKSYSKLPSHVIATYVYNSSQNSRDNRYLVNENYLKLHKNKIEITFNRSYENISY